MVFTRPLILKEPDVGGTICFRSLAWKLDKKGRTGAEI